MSIQSELHNRLAGEIVKSIVMPPLEAGGDFKDVMVLLESVIAGSWAANPFVVAYSFAVERRNIDAEG